MGKILSQTVAQSKNRVNPSLPSSIQPDEFATVLDAVEAGEISFVDGVTLKTGPIVVVDVRNDYERSSIVQMPKKSVWLNIPMDAIQSCSVKLEKTIDKISHAENHDPIVFAHCAKGIRSAKARDYLSKLGIPIVSVDGSIEGLPAKWLKPGPSQ
eukprot:GDKJ01018455.1.p1 GENE.GDKJ01018455.1~~GDKJ01018455.1.p1  ORF type:complete len:182 (+),score=21.91 GDKJ01018455.1:82-546(+)